MNRRLLMLLALVAALSLASLLVAAQQTGGDSAYTGPRTPWGDPDLQGVFTSDDSLGVGIQRREEFGDRLFLNEQEYSERVERNASRAASFEVEIQAEDAEIRTGPPGHWLELGDELSRQTSLIIDPPDGRYPELTPEGRERRGLGSFSPDSPGSWEDFTLYIRCITRGVTGSILPVIYGNGTQIVQSPGYVAIANEMVHEAWIIPLDGSPFVGEDIRMYMGDSRGHWEDDTLVIETRNLTDRTGIAVNGGGTRHTEDMVLIERIRRIAPDRLYYKATFNDPATWTAPFTVGYPIVDKPTYQVYEYACHEGNNAMFNMLSGARADEGAVAAAEDQ